MQEHMLWESKMYFQTKKKGKKVINLGESYGVVSDLLF